MPRDLTLGNGSLLVNFDRNYTLRDIYFPHVGQENHTAGDPNKFGVWVDGRFSWLDSDDWRRDLRYDDNTLVTRATCFSDRLGLELVCVDCVDFNRNVYFKRVGVRDHSGRKRYLRLFQHIDLHLWGNAIGDTALFDPDHRALVGYKSHRYVWLGARAGEADGLTHWATGDKEIAGKQGTWRDAEDGELSGNPIAQGSVDCVGGVDLVVQASGSAIAYFWVGTGTSYDEVREHHEMVVRRGPQSFIDRTHAYWHLWVNKEKSDFGDLPPEVVQLYKQSLLILRTQIDNGGAIVAANDADIQRFGRDTYSYMWPRDGALAAHALVLAGHEQVTRNFFDFCAHALRPEGYLLHKYNPDGSLGSSWHSWLAPDGSKQLPIQEDETALVLWALWTHFQHFRDVEFIKPLYRKLVIRAADFLCRFREPLTGLPAPSYDLWEERHGIMAYTTAAVVAGIGAAANFAEAFGELGVAAAYRQEANAIRVAARQHLYDTDRGCFSRMICVQSDGSIERDDTVDASIAGVLEFGLLAPDDPLISTTMEAIERQLWCKTTIGGIARYEDDHYQQVSHDLDRVPGNPWFICTLWLANWHVARAQKIEDLARARELLEWVVAHALPSGILAEQIHPYTGEPLSVSPLTWSHAAFIEVVRQYSARLNALSH